MSNAHLLYAFMITVTVPFHAMGAEKELTGKRPKLILDEYVPGSKSFDFFGEEPEYVRLYKEWIHIKDPKVSGIPFRDAGNNIVHLQWLIAKRKEELSHLNLHSNAQHKLTTPPHIN